jgi:hypothetical protein
MASIGLGASGLVVLQLSANRYIDVRGISLRLNSREYGQ